MIEIDGKQYATAYDLDLAARGIRECLVLGVPKENLLKVALRQTNLDMRIHMLETLKTLTCPSEETVKNPH